jgi:DNA polymerase|nr:MAG TPA: DNA polymerase [Caudoviricetes sp.]
MLNFYDFEVFKYDWLVVIINPIEKTITKIVNDPQALKDYFEAHCNEIWIGYNNRRYDQYIMKAILLGMDPKEVNDWIIVDNKPGWQYSSLFNKITMINFDTMLRTDTGLKSLEAFMGNDIRETSVPFNINRRLTKKEIEQTSFYCNHDVEQTIEVWLARKAEFDAAMGLVKIFNLPLTYMGKTGAQRVAKILGGKGKKFNDEFEFPIVNTLKLKKYRAIRDWYRNPENHDYKKKQKVIIAGIEHTLAWGGLHGAIKKYYGEGIYLMADVTAYYPSLQEQYKFGYRNMANPENFEKIHGENLRMKATGNKVARLPYKIADNAISGQLKDQYSPLYDPRENNAICVNGQLLLVDLIEKLEPYCKLIQSNTDGILLKLKSIDDFDLIDDIVWGWEKRTGMRMGFDIYTKVFQKDVNNYLLVAPDGKTKTKGAYTKALSSVDYDLPIINKAMVEFMTKGIPVEKTTNDCDDLIMFQKVVKLSGKYWRSWHNGKYMAEKCHRVFASKDKRATYIGKCKKEGATIEKFANTPDHCFIDNGSIKGKKRPDYLDTLWYINLAKDRLAQYGVEV